MADHPSDEWDDDAPGPRVLKRRAIDTREVGEERGGHKTVTGTDRYRTPDPVGHRLTKDPDKKKAKGKAVHSDAAEDKAVKSAAKK